MPPRLQMSSEASSGRMTRLNCCCHTCPNCPDTSAEEGEISGLGVSYAVDLASGVFWFAFRALQRYLSL
jgi:hypothetical protein